MHEYACADADKRADDGGTGYVDLVPLLARRGRAHMLRMGRRSCLAARLRDMGLADRTVLLTDEAGKMAA